MMSTTNSAERPGARDRVRGFEAQTRLIVDEMRALRLEIEALRARATS